MRLKVCYYTNKGFRQNNEDALLIDTVVLQEEFMEKVECLKHEGSGLFAVADGLGGHRGGELASRILLETFREEKPQREEDILNALKVARDRLEHFAKEHPAYSGLGTAVAGLVLVEGKTIVFNVGDCRVYGIEKDRAVRLTEDHTEAEDLVRAGLLDPIRAKHDPRRNYLTSAIIGDSEFINFEVFMKDVYGYRRYIVCSDGVWEALEDEELSLPPQVMVELLLEKGGSDNMSFIDISLEE